MSMQKRIKKSRKNKAGPSCQWNRNSIYCQSYNHSNTKKTLPAAH